MAGRWLTAALASMLRLKTRAQFQAVMAAGVRARSAHFALHRLLPDAQGAAAVLPAADAAPRPGPQALFAATGSGADVWIGALLPKRWARRAVTRNAIRRQIYAVAQECAQVLVPAAYVVRLRAAFERRCFVSASSRTLKQALRAELQQLFAAAARRQGGMS